MIPPPPIKRKRPILLPRLPAGQFVRISHMGNGTFEIVTTRLGNPVGPRLWKGAGELPEGATKNLTMAEARQALAVWEKFIKQNQ